MVLDFAPSLLATHPVSLGAPFVSVKSVGGEKDSDNLSERFNSGAAALWDRIVSWRDLVRPPRAITPTARQARASTHPPA